MKLRYEPHDAFEVPFDSSIPPDEDGMFFIPDPEQQMSEGALVLLNDEMRGVVCLTVVASLWIEPGGPQWCRLEPANREVGFVTDIHDHSNPVH